MPSRPRRPRTPIPTARPEPVEGRPELAEGTRPELAEGTRPELVEGRVLVLHGPNLNLLGTREPEIYGATTLSEIDRRILRRAATLSLGVDIHQSNHEGVLVDLLHAARERCHAVVINPAGLTHTSVVLRDAIAAIALPAIEVHLTNTLAREPFRHTSLVGGVCKARIEGLGALGYELALEAVASLLRVPTR